MSKKAAPAKPTHGIQFSVATKDLRETMTRLQQIPGSKSVIPAVRITASLEGITLTRVTPEAIMRASTADSEVVTEGEVEVDFGTLSQLAGRVSASQLSVEQADDKLILRGGTATMHLRVLPKGSVPATPEPDAGDQSPAGIKLPVAELEGLLGVVKDAASNDPSHVGYVGVCARTIGKQLYFIATNRKSLHRINTGHEAKVDMMIPSEVISAISSAFDKSDGEAMVGFHPNGLYIVTPRVGFFSKVSESNLPKLDSFFAMVEKAEITQTINIGRSEFLEAIKAAAPVSRGDLRAVDLTIERGAITIYASNDQDAEISLRLEASTKGEGKVRVSSKLLQNVLESASGEDITIHHLPNPGALYLPQDDRLFTVAIMRMGQE